MNGIKLKKRPGSYSFVALAGIFWIYLLSFNALHAQLSAIPGTPYIKNFTEEEVRNDLTIFDVAQGEKGTMYFATPHGLLQFDGIDWKVNSFEQESDLRAVYYKDDSRIYVSGHGGFGYWSKNELGLLEYTSLFFKRPEKDDTLLPVFSQIAEVSGKILFQTFQRIYVYDPEAHTTEVLNAITGFNKLIFSKGRAFIQDLGGLYEYRNGKLELIDPTNPEEFHIVDIVAKGKDELHIITKDRGWWRLKDGGLQKLDLEVNTALERALVNDVAVLDSGKMALGTVRDGVFILSNAGRLLSHLKKEDGISGSSIRKAFADRDNNIWLGMDNGLSYVQTNTKTNFLMDSKGVFGTVYTCFMEDSLLYLGTNQGLFVKDLSKENSVPELIDESVGQVWTIDKLNGNLLVGSHQGVSVLEGKKLTSLHKEAGAWIFRKHHNYDDILYVGFYSGIKVFKRSGETWSYVNKLENYGESSRFMEFDKYGNLWVSHPTKGYYRLSLSHDGFHLRDVEFYGIDNPFVETYAYFTIMDNELVFYNPAGLFNYDPIDNSFTRSKYASTVFKGLKGVNSITQSGQFFWYSTPDNLGSVLRLSNNSFVRINEPFYSVRNKHLNDFNSFTKLNDSLYAFGIKNGMVFHVMDGSLQITSDHKQPVIRYIHLIGAKDTILAPIDQKDVFEIPYSNRMVEIGVSHAKVALSNPRTIQYKLSGISNEWQDMDLRSPLSFPGLSPGTYTLEVRTDAGADNTSPVLKKSFRVNPPWYFSNTAFFTYFLFVVVFNLGYRNYFKKKAQKDLDELKQKEEEKRLRQMEKFELERLASEKEKLLLREEKLQLAVVKKNSELATSTLNNIKKKELLNELIEDIKAIDKEVLNSKLNRPIKNVIKKINKHLDDKDDWLTFELNFKNAHTDFFDNLAERHPDLSPTEIKLSAYLKINLSTKEIASLMNISVKSVEQGRWRLRKKLDLPKDVGLVNYFQTF
ncbi:ligand-binding sensor domain-containing protein [Robertkochia sediminum]|uniref:ligand-binding sensor domain-containing protein n=1 Tax=Robertkochia sediminum TaxID=2785326 RepID=UPI001F2DED35|nr:hypothetical protein [Robertkochia sediminum]